MSRPLPLKQKQVTALAKGAAAAGCIAEVKIGDVVVRLIPKEIAQVERPIDSGNDDDLDAELAAFEAKHGDG